VASPSGKGCTFSLETPSLSSRTLDKYLKQVLGEGSSGALPELLKTVAESAGASSSTSPSSVVSEAPKVETPAQQPAAPTTESKPVPVSNPPPSVVSVTSTPVIATVPTSVSSDAPSHGLPAHTLSQTVSAAQVNNASNQQLATTDSLVSGQSGEMIPIPRGQSYVDITDYLNMPQADAAKKLGIPPSTLSKRWKEAVRKRKWPYRMICKIDKEIMTLLHNVPQGPNAPPLPEEIETALGLLLRKRQEELRPVVIRI